MLRAFQLAPLKDPPHAAAPLLAHADPLARAAALDIFAFHGVDRGEALLVHLGDEAPVVRAAACRAARAARTGELGQALSWRLEDPDPAVRMEAARAGLMHRISGSWPCCLALAEAGDPEAQLLAGALGAEEQLGSLIEGLKDEQRRVGALVALGYMGRVEAVPHCLAYITGPPRVARLAGEAISLITGLELGREGLALEDAPPGEELPALEDDDLEADLSDAPEDALPLPDAGALSRWWEQHGSAYQPGVRLHRGQPATAAGFAASLNSGPMRQRHAVAEELMLRTRGSLMVQSRSWCARQRSGLDRAIWPRHLDLATPWATPFPNAGRR